MPQEEDVETVTLAAADGEWEYDMVLSSLPPLQEDDAEAATQACHYCGGACETDLLSGEAVWLCIWCHAVAHTRCYQASHRRASEDIPTRRR